MNRLFAFGFVFVFATACDDSSSQDAGAGDAGFADALVDAGPDASRDASPADSGRPDALPDLGFEDAQVPDASADAAELDAELDAGAADADGGDAEPDAEVDAGEPDAGEIDLGVPDAGFAVCPTTCEVTTPIESIPTNGLVLWLRGDQGVNVGPSDAVCMWCDLSGNAHDMPAAGMPMRQAIGAGGQPTVQTGAGSYFARGDLLTIPAASGRTFIAVYRLRNPASRSQPVGQGQASTAGTYVQIDGNTFNTPGQFYGVYVTNNAYSCGTQTSTQPAVHVMRLDSMTAGTPVLNELDYFINGTGQTLTRTPGGLGNTNIESLANANFTAVGSAASLFEVSEILVYDRPLADPERTEVEAYLQARYGL